MGEKEILTEELAKALIAKVSLLVKVADRDGPHVYRAKKYALSTWMAMVTLKADELAEVSGGMEGLTKILGELEEILQMQVVQVRWA